MDPYGKVSPGQRGRIQATTLNATVDAARAHRDSRFDSERTDLPPSPYGPTIVRVRNISGQTLDRFSVVALGEPVIDPDDNLAEWQNKTAFDVDLVAAVTDAVCILLEPLGEQAIGRAVVSGVAVCQVTVNTEGDLFAVPVASATNLSSGSGAIEILWVESGTGSGKWAVVRFATAPTITVAEVDGTPNYTGISTIKYDSADGFVVTNPSAGVARVDIAAATNTQAGIVGLASQVLGDGNKFAPDKFVCGYIGSGTVSTAIPPFAPVAVGFWSTALGVFHNAVYLPSNIADATSDYALLQCSGEAFKVWCYDALGGGGTLQASFEVHVNGFSIYAAGVFAFYFADSTGSYTGDTGTDSLGNEFTGGICTAVGGGTAVSLGGTNTWTGTNTFNNAVTIGTGQTLTVTGATIAAGAGATLTGALTIQGATLAAGSGATISGAVTFTGAMTLGTTIGATGAPTLNAVAALGTISAASQAGCGGL